MRADLSALERAVSDIPAPGLLYWTMHGLGRWLWPFLGGIRVHGRHHIPPAGPYLLLSNHQSVLDPFFIQTWIPYPIHPMAKSTQFAGPVFGPVMKRMYTFPVRRFQVDAHAVRTTLRYLEAGHAVHIYVEGERSWDGAMRPPRPGTVRLALKAGVPIVPCAVDGAYDVWPRWDRRPRRGPVTVAFGAPFRLPQIHDRRLREEALPGATARIMNEIRSLLDLPTSDPQSAED